MFISCVFEYVLTCPYLSQISENDLEVTEMEEQKSKEDHPRSVAVSVLPFLAVTCTIKNEGLLPVLVCCCSHSLTQLQNGIFFYIWHWIFDASLQ